MLVLRRLLFTSTSGSLRATIHKKAVEHPKFPFKPYDFFYTFIINDNEVYNPLIRDSSIGYIKLVVNGREVSKVKGLLLLTEDCAKEVLKLHELK